MGLKDRFLQILKLPFGGSKYDKNSNTTTFWGSEADDRKMHLTSFSMDAADARREKNWFAYEFSREGIRRRRR